MLTSVFSPTRSFAPTLVLLGVLLWFCAISGAHAGDSAVYKSVSNILSTSPQPTAWLSGLDSSNSCDASRRDPICSLSAWKLYRAMLRS